VKVPGAKGNTAFLDQARVVLESLEGVLRVEVRPVTGSVIVEYDPENYESFHDDLREQVAKQPLFTPHRAGLTELDETVDRLEREAEFLTSRSTTARVIVDFLRDCDVKVKQATNNAVDLKVLVPLALAAYAITVMELTASTPMWATLGLFSFNHFLELHSHDQDPHVIGDPRSKDLPVKTLRQF
jgi:hypothetical protein